MVTDQNKQTKMLSGLHGLRNCHIIDCRATGLCRDTSEPSSSSPDTVSTGGNDSTARLSLAGAGTEYVEPRALLKCFVLSH